jgi:hypothetical protein
MAGAEKGRLKDRVVLFIHVCRNATMRARLSFCVSECYLQYLCPTFVSYFVHVLFLTSPQLNIVQDDFQNLFIDLDTRLE